MKDLENTVFDESVDGYTPVVPGVYPAHVVDLTTKDSRNDGTKFANDSVVFNITFSLADECKKLKVKKMAKNGSEWSEVLDADGNTIDVPGDYLVGKKFNSKGVWLTPSPAPGDGWKNRAYKEMFENLGAQFKEVDGKVKLGFVEKEDIIGMPCLVTLGEEEYVASDGTTKYSTKAFNCHVWNDGARLSEAEVGEDLPF
jgi:hypothetical protein